MQKVLNLFDFSQKVNYRNEIFAGLTVAMTMIPESLSFAILAGFSPLTGLYAAFIMGLVTAILGGRPGLISGGAGATVIVLIPLMISHGIEYVFATVVLAGIIQIIVGIFKLGKFIRLVPQSVMYGFVNGLAIVIFMSQINQFKIQGSDSWLSGNPLYIMMSLVALTVSVILIFPKLTKKIPASLVAIAVTFALVMIFGIQTKTVDDIANIAGGFPPFQIPNVEMSFEVLKVIFPFALIMSTVGLTEGLLTLNLVDEITNTKGNSNRECVAQGTANILNGFFFGMGGCPMIAQTLVNLSAGARARLSGIVAALVILFIILFGAPVIGKMPVAALVGVMIMVSVGTFEWASFKAIKRFPKSDIFVMVVVTLVTVFLHNLALAVLIGVIISALVFAWESAKRIRARKFVDGNGVKHYEIFGPLFFGSTTIFAEKFDVMNDPDEVIIDFKESRIADMSAIDILNKLTERYKNQGKTLVLKNVSRRCKRLIKNAENVVDINIIEDKED